ncbi:MMPL family transporter [Nocardiopsis sp. M1B1]|uniref:MMPL family transporter n=1 Tax=Nocardiopsis sp. M1B1 TaxID=3450454 RepID=UPI00403900CE
MATSPTTTSPPGRRGASPGRPPFLVRLGDGLARRPGRVILAGVALVLVALALAAGTMDRLLLSRFESPGSESLRVEQRLEEGFGTGKYHFLLLVTAQQGTVDDPEVVEAATALERDLASREGVAETASYWGRGESPAMRSEDGTQALITVRMEGTVTEARTALGEISPDLTRDGEVVRVEVGGGDEVFRQAAEQAQADFLLAEAIIFPLVFVLLLVLYRRISVAALTLGMGLFSVVTTLALLRGVTHLTDVSTFAANLTLVMGVGLGVDYSLFVINRFREELARGRQVPEAVSLAVSKAGRTVLFSGLTVAVALSCLMLFPFPFLQSFAYAGVGTVLTSVFAALVILPAALAKVGHRVRPKREPDPDSGWWHSTALRMMRRPLLWGLPALAVVLVLAAPAVGLDILAITFVILFLMTGSILLPAKAIVLNVLSLAVMFGVMVWIFQEGNLSGLLGFTANGTLETTFPILMFCIAFGLSMDYEVFMMSRIKEEYDLTGDNTRAVAAGLQRSGPLVTAAAVILAASFAAYAVSDVLYLMMLAVGMAVVILVDATLIRGVLVPVFMRLAGRANWWAPAPLKRVHARFGIAE